MKRILLVICFAFYTTFSFSQNSPPDSLKLLLRTASNASDKLKLIEELILIYQTKNWDTVVVYSEKMLRLGIQQKDEAIIAKGKEYLGEAYYNKGNYSKALDLAIQSLKFVESTNQKAPLANMLNNIGNIYKGQENYTKARHYYRRCEKIAASVNDTTDLVFAYGNLTYIYDKLHKPDSALLYAKKFIAAPRVNGYNISNVYAVMGDVYFKEKNKRLAQYYYNLAIQSAKQSSNIRDLSKVSLSLAQYFRKINQLDSSIFYAQEALTNGRKSSYNKSVYESTELLFRLYDELQMPDSAFKYLKITSKAKDELYSVARFQEVENLTASEERRHKEIAEAKAAYETNLKFYLLGFLLLVFLTGAILLWRNNKNKQKAYVILQAQKQETEAQREVAEEALKQLKTTQNQLVQSEKMASLGELTAGIAHEIQNPLNFVNNFSEVSLELLEEMEEELAHGDKEEAIALAADVKANLNKIHHHGKRADSIVKGMLQHSRSNTGATELTNLNALAEEYLRLSYHGLRANDKSFNAELVTDLAPDLEKIVVVPQEIGRVLLNLFNNALYAVSQKQKTAAQGYTPQVTVVSKNVEDFVEITVRDNGTGIPAAIRDKILQPFFTTKPTGQGTGLGLSISYDIITKGHGGTIHINSKEGEFSEFVITLPILKHKEE